MNKNLSIFILSVSVFILSDSLFAQSATFLTVPADARSMGLANASIAFDANAFAIQTNPAAMAFANNRLSVATSYGIWQPLVSNNHIFSISGFGKTTGNLAFGVSARYFTHHPYTVTGEQGTIIGSYTPKEYDVEIGAAYKISRFSIGANIKYISSAIGEQKKGNAFAADIAIMYKWDNISVAASAVNLGTKIRYGESAPYSLPTMFKVGMKYNISIADNHSLTLGAEGDYLIKSGGMIGAGVEYAYNELAFLRFGYHYADPLKATPSYSSVGLGVRFLGVTINGAYLFVLDKSPLKNTLSFSLGYEF